MHLTGKHLDCVTDCLTEPLRFAELFQRDAPVEIDLGCGDGTFLTQLAAANPDRNFLGIDRSLQRVRTACRKTAQLNLENVRVLRMEAGYAMSWLVPLQSVSAVHLLFPDPWPKRRHHRRRTFTSDFLLAVNRALTREGLFHVATDDADYFHQMQRILGAGSMFAAVAEPMPFPRTRFEQRFIAQRVPIYRTVLRKVAPVT